MAKNTRAGATGRGKNLERQAVATSQQDTKLSKLHKSVSSIIKNQGVGFARTFMPTGTDINNPTNGQVGKAYTELTDHIAEMAGMLHKSGLLAGAGKSIDEHVNHYLKYTADDYVKNLNMSLKKQYPSEHKKFVEKIRASLQKNAISK
jgi:hypothetical protein